MQRQSVLADIKKIDSRLSAKQQYLCHYTINSEFKKLLKAIGIKNKQDIELPEDCKSLVISVKAKISSLEASNRKLIEVTHFEDECHRLIKNGDLANFIGLIDIAHYFGVKKPHRSDAASALDYVLQVYQLSANKRTEKSKECLDYLCDLLRVKKLSFPKAMSVHEMIDQSLFLSKKAMVDKILVSDDSIKLMTWFFDTTNEDREYALRVAASKEGMFNCLMFLLSYARPDANKNMKISLLAQGGSSGQCALHRAVSSNSSKIVYYLMTCESNDVLDQLLVTDKKQKTPVDYLLSVDDDDEFDRMVKYITKAISENKSKANLMDPILAKIELLKEAREMRRVYNIN